MANTKNYGLHIIDKKTEVLSSDRINENMVKVDDQMKVNENQIKILDDQVKNIDVVSGVRSVINERVNTDTTYPLNTLISGWVDTAKTAILNAIATLTNHVTACRDNTNNHITSQHTATKNTVNSARDNVNSTVNTARDNIKSHITSELGSPKVVKSVQRGWVGYDDPVYIENKYYKEYAISAVVPNKTMINLYSAEDDAPVCGMLIGTNQLRVFANGYSNKISKISWEVIEFY